MPEPNPTTSPVIEMRQAAIANSHVPERAVIEEVTWQIAARDYWAVGGLPASGKSDLLVTAAGLQKPLRGFFELFGRDTAELSADELARERLRIGLMFGEEGRLFQELSVAENVALPLSYHRNLRPPETAETVAELLEMLDLSAVAHRMPSGIHRHLRPRVALARALALRPEVLLLDEPLRGLDRRDVRWWLDLLGRLSQGHAFFGGRPVTLVITTNDLSAWAGEAGRFGLIHRKRWVLVGDREALKGRTQPALREWMDFLET